MRRGKGKGKKRGIVAANEDLGSGEEEKVPVSKRRGRPQKIVRDNNIQEQVQKKEQVSAIQTDNGFDTESERLSNKSIITQTKEENLSSAVKLSTDDSVKSAGFRQIGSRRKNKPRRAAEAGVECM